MAYDRGALRMFLKKYRSDLGKPNLKIVSPFRLTLFLPCLLLHLAIILPCLRDPFLCLPILLLLLFTFSCPSYISSSVLSYPSHSSSSPSPPLVLLFVILLIAFPILPHLPFPLLPPPTPSPSSPPTPSPRSTLFLLFSFS